MTLHCSLVINIEASKHFLDDHSIVKGRGDAIKGFHLDKRTGSLLYDFDKNVFFATYDCLIFTKDVNISFGPFYNHPMAAKLLRR